MSKWKWLLRQFTRRLWVRATLIGALGVAAAILALLADHLSPEDFILKIKADAIDSILTIIASSMLAVTTFSLSVMTSAFATATSNVTPRATRLLAEDYLTQNVLATFIGAFLFSIVGLVVLKAGAYGPSGRVVLFIVTIAVLILVVVSLMRWIDHLTSFGRVGDTTSRVEDATRTAIETRINSPYLGGRALADLKNGVPESAIVVKADRTGNIALVDMEHLTECMDDLGGTVYLAAIPGAFVYEGSVLAHVDAPDADREKIIDRIRKAFTVTIDRDFDQDPRFGVTVLSEIALRALSPGINDPGTAVDVVGRMARLMTIWANALNNPPDVEIDYPTVYVPPLKTADLFSDAFERIAREGAGTVEVQLALRNALSALYRLGDEQVRNAAKYQAELAIKRADLAEMIEEDKAKLEKVALG